MEKDNEIVVTFKDETTRERFRRLCQELGKDELELAQHLLTNFIDYCEEVRPLQKVG